MPPTHDPANRVKAKRTLDSTSGTLRANRGKILPYEMVMLTWETAIRNQELPVVFKLRTAGREITISNSGDIKVFPLADSRYNLVAHCDVLSKNLGVVVIDADTDACEMGFLPESFIQLQIEKKIEMILREHSSLSRRKPDYIEVDNEGLHLRLAFKTSIDNWFDPDVNIKALIRFFVQDKMPQFTIVNYDFQLDFPWYADAVNLSFMPAWLAIAISEGNERGSVKHQLVTSFAEALELFKQQHLNSNTLIFRAVKDAIAYTICPKPKPSSNNPHPTQ